MAAEELRLDGRDISPKVNSNAAHDRVVKLLGTLSGAWMEFRESYAGLPDDALLEPGVAGRWSIRDLIAHVTWWDEEAIKHLPLILDGGRPPRYSVAYGGIDAFNALMTERKAGLTLNEVRAEFAETHRRLVDYLLGVPSERLVVDSRFRRRLRLDTYGHYPIHTADIRRWRARHDNTLPADETA